MSDNNSLIIKNGSCYINGKLENTDITLSYVYAMEYNPYPY